jgi:hypothetical protein
MSILTSGNRLNGRPTERSEASPTDQVTPVLEPPAASFAKMPALLAHLAQIAELVLCVPPESFQASIRSGKVPVVLMVRSVSRSAPRLEESECERDILALLEDQRQRLTGEEIRQKLQHRGALHGDSTINHALASLNRRKHKSGRKE